MADATILPPTAPDEPPHPPRERHMTPVNLVLIIGAVLVAAAGQVLLRHGMQVAKAASADGGSLIIHAATSPSVLGGLVVFGVSALLWLAALARVPLSLAYPFNALGYLGILAASALILHENVRPLTWLGSSVVVAGLILVVLSAPKS